MEAADILQKIISPAGEVSASTRDAMTLRTLSGDDAGMLTPSFGAGRPDIFKDDDFELNEEDVREVSGVFEFSENFSPQTSAQGSPETKRGRMRGASVESSPSYSVSELVPNDPKGVVAKARGHIREAFK